MARPHDDIAIIRRIMEESRREVGERGLHFLIWGAIATGGLLATYLFARGRLGLDPGWIWVGLLAVGWAASMLIGWREGRQARTRTLGRRLLSATWISMAIVLTLIGLAGSFGDVVGHASLPGLLSTIVAAPILVTALLTGERWLRWVAAAWWVGGAVMLFVPGPYTLPLMAAMSLLLMAVPGGILNARARRRKDGAEGAITDTA